MPDDHFLKRLITHELDNTAKRGRGAKRKDVWLGCAKEGAPISTIRGGMGSISTGRGQVAICCDGWYTAVYGYVEREGKRASKNVGERERERRKPDPPPQQQLWREDPGESPCHGTEAKARFPIRFSPAVDTSSHRSRDASLLFLASFRFSPPFHFFLSKSMKGADRYYR